MWLWGDRQSGSAGAFKKGTDKRNIIIVDLAESCVQSAASSGYIALLGDPTHKNILIDAGIKKASKCNYLSWFRRIECVVNSKHKKFKWKCKKIIACVNNSENFKLMRQLGVNVTVQPSQLEVILLA